MDPDLEDRDRSAKQRSTNGYSAGDQAGFNSRLKESNNDCDSGRRRRDGRDGLDDRYRGRDTGSRTQPRDFDGGRALPPPDDRQRSLSPYSKRLALTQAMNMGR